MTKPKEDRLWRSWVILSVFLNTACTLMSLYIGGWNLLTIPLSLGVACLYAYEWGKLT